MIAGAAAAHLAAMDASREGQDEPTMNANTTLAAVDGVTETEPKHARKKAVQISVRYDERELDQLTQLKLHTLRSEITALNRSLRERNATITRLRAESRTHARVMRLKSEARMEGRGELLAEVTAVAAGIRDEQSVTKLAVGRVAQLGG